MAAPPVANCSRENSLVLLPGAINLALLRSWMNFSVSAALGSARANRPFLKSKNCSMVIVPPMSPRNIRWKSVLLVGLARQYTLGVLLLICSHVDLSWDQVVGAWWGSSPAS